MAKLQKRLEALEVDVHAKASKPASQWTDRELWELIGIDPDGPLPTDEELQALLISEQGKDHANS
jgi:hypothetical protein